MADLNEKTVKKIAKLAHIHFSESDLNTITQKVSHIISWAEQLKEVDTTNVKPMVSIVPTSLKQREDTVTDGGYPDIIVKNAPLKDGHFFCVPKVVE